MGWVPTPDTFSRTVRAVDVVKSLGILVVGALCSSCFAGSITGQRIPQNQLVNVKARRQQLRKHHLQVHQTLLSSLYEHPYCLQKPMFFKTPVSQFARIFARK
jgi:hypothetical protein